MIPAIANRVILAEGWGRALMAFVAGALGALAMPPFGIWPALAVSLTVAVWLIDGSAAGRRFPFTATLGRAALAGWFWGFGYFVAGLWWLGSAFLVEPDLFAWLLPFGVLGLPAVAALYPALGFALARVLWSRGWGRLFALGFGLTVSEWLRGHLFTGFPWNVYGMALGQNTWLLQSVSLLGLYGLTIVATVVLASPAVLGTGEGRNRVVPPLVGAAVLLLMAGYGAWRVPAEAVPTVPGVKLRIMQPNLAQDAKFGPANGGEILRDYLALSDRATSPQSRGLADVTHLIWPESAFPFLLAREPAALAEIAAALPKGAVLITGAARAGEPLAGEKPRSFYNSIQAVNAEGAITATYDKVHLVPFGEYVPTFVDRLLGSLGLRQFVQIPGGFTAGTRHPFKVAGLPPVAATICYEASFPDEVVPPGPRPGMILNVTNDGWFGDTPGPRQHFAQARMRAVENGLPLVRAANTGISAVVDPYGRIVAALPVGQAGVLDSALPSSLPDTFFSKYGILVALLLCTVCAGVAIAEMKR